MAQLIGLCPTFDILDVHGCWDVRMNKYLMAAACPITTETQMFEQADKIGKREIVVSLVLEYLLS